MKDKTKENFLNFIICFLLIILVLFIASLASSVFEGVGSKNVNEEQHKLMAEKVCVEKGYASVFSLDCRECYRGFCRLICVDENGLIGTENFKIVCGVN